VTPMTGTVTDAKEDRFIICFSFVKGFLPPGEPVNGIVGMLQQIGTFLAGEFVGLSLYVH
jgi:hypothetical protein